MTGRQFEILPSQPPNWIVRSKSWDGLSVCAKDACEIAMASAPAEINNFFIFSLLTFQTERSSSNPVSCRPRSNSSQSPLSIHGRMNSTPPPGHERSGAGPFRPTRAPFPVLVQYRLEWLGRLPFGMLLRHRPQAVERESGLKIDRLLAPQCAVVVEGGDALLDGNEVGTALGGHARDKLDDGFLGGAVVPGR